MVGRFGRYEILRPLGRGGMAEVFLARLTGVGGFSRPVVIKRVRPDMVGRPDLLQMFLDEARLGARLTHSGIVQVLDFGEADGAHFMALEFVDGGHVGRLLAVSCFADDPPPLALCAYLVGRVAEGLAFAHDAVEPLTKKPLNVVHRDVSPQNILVSRYGEVKVADFGVAKNAGQLARTGTGVIKGKIPYMAPEQILAEGVDRRTDIFALGIVLHELLTRQRLFKDESDALTMKRIVMDAVAPPSSANPDVDGELDRITLRALQRDREMRYDDAREMGLDLQRWYLARLRDDPRRLLAEWVCRQLERDGPGLPEGVEDTLPSFTGATRAGKPAAAAPPIAVAATPARDTVVDLAAPPRALLEVPGLAPDEPLRLLAGPGGCAVYRWGADAAPLYLVELVGHVDAGRMLDCLEAVWDDPGWAARYAVVLLTGRATGFDRELKELYGRPSLRPPVQMGLVTRRGLEGAVLAAVAGGMRALTGAPLRTYPTLAAARAGALKALATS